MSQSLRGDQVFLGLVAVFLHGERLILSQSLRGDQVFLGSGNGCRNRGCRVGLNPSVVIRSFWGKIHMPSNRTLIMSQSLRGDQVFLG